eukprot:jgi/Botrbrau1/9504/Bobra.0252s0119.1
MGRSMCPPMTSITGNVDSVQSQRMFGTAVTGVFRGPQHSRRQNCRCLTVMKGNGRFFVGGNWKANGTRDSIKDLVGGLNTKPVPADVEVVVAPVFIHLPYVIDNIKPGYQVAAQNCWVEQPGAHTGEVTAAAVKDFGASWVILGHSERRRGLIGESSELVGKKVARALAESLKVIACIGETLEEREAGKLQDVIHEQLSGIAASTSESDWDNIVIAYEPVWAIGTGKVATPEQAQEVHAFIRNWLAEKVGAKTASSVRVIYGGSVNGANCSELAMKEDIDGFLVGGASLKPDEFATITHARLNGSHTPKA